MKYKGQSEIAEVLVVGCSIAFVLIVIVIASFVRFSSAGIGRHTGYITAVEQEGYFYQNYRIYVKTDLSSSQEDIYCMKEDRKDLAEQLNKARESKSRVTLVYDGVRGLGWDLCIGYEIVGVQLIDEGKPNE